MSYPFVLKILANICLWFSCAAALTDSGADAPVYLAAAAICGLGALISSLARRKPALRVITALLPLACVLFFTSVRRGIVIGIPIGYTLVMLLIGLYHTDAWSYATHLKFSSIGAALSVLYAAAAGDSVVPVALFALAAVLFGITANRQMRMGEGTDLKERLLDGLCVLLAPALGGIAYFIVFVLPSKYPVILQVLLFPFTLLKMLLKWLIGLIPQETVTETVPITTPEPTAEPTPFIYSIFPEEELEAVEPVEIPWLKPLLITIGIIAAVTGVTLIILWVYRNRDRLSPERVDKFERIFTPEKGRDRERRAENADPSRARRIRKVYQKYLRLLRSNGITPAAENTSKDILTMTLPRTDGDDAARELRSLYIRARYHTGDPLTEEDVERARNALRKIKASFSGE